MTATTSSLNGPIPKPCAVPTRLPWTVNLLTGLWLWLWLWLAPMLQAQFTYTTFNDQVTITGYTGPGGGVEIPATINGFPVIAIGDRAFENQTNLTTIRIPDSVTDIGFSAFAGCSSLTGLTIPAGVTTIGPGVIRGCASLESIEVDPLNAHFSSIDGVLADKAGKTLVAYPVGRTGPYTIPDSVTLIADRAFNGCNGMTDVVLGNNVAMIGGGHFLVAPT